MAISIKLTNLTILSRSIFTTCRNNISLGNPSLRRSLEDRLGLPPKPKRPLTPYFRFMKQIRTKISEENPQAAVPEIIKLISVKWRNLDNNIKKQLQEDYKKEQTKYIESRVQYDSKITDEQREDLKNLKEELNEAKERKAVKMKIRALGKPKRPSSSFLRFLIKEKSIASLGTLSYKEWQKKIAEKWSRLSDADKKIYIEETNKDKVKYMEELKKWEERMISLGHIDIVRHEALVEIPAPKSKRRTTKLA